MVHLKLINNHSVLPKNTNNYNKKSQNVNRDKPHKRSTSPVKVYSNVRWKKGNLIKNERSIKKHKNNNNNIITVLYFMVCHI